MWHYLRFTILSAGALGLVLAFGFAFQLAWATRLWPWHDSRLSYIFVGSIFAAVAAPCLWIAVSAELGAIAGVALDVAVFATMAGAYLIRLYISRSSGQLLASAIVLLVIAAGAVTLYLDSRSIPVHDRRPIPFPVRIAFLVFVAVLVLASVALFRHTAHIFPWPLRAETSVMAGAVFVSSAVYFIYSFTRRYWGEVSAPLIAFLAYDLVLIGPFVRHFGTVLPAHRLSLVLYVVALLISGGIATYYLLFAPSTRLIGSTTDDTSPLDAETA